MDSVKSRELSMLISKEVLPSLNPSHTYMTSLPTATRLAESCTIWLPVVDLKFCQTTSTRLQAGFTAAICRVCSNCMANVRQEHHDHCSTRPSTHIKAKVRETKAKKRERDKKHIFFFKNIYFKNTCYLLVKTAL